jgi:protein gp37
MPDVDWLRGHKVHPAANIYPLIQGDEFDALVASIADHGLQVPVTLDPTGELVVDGRNRLRACFEANVDPRFERLPFHYDELAILDFVRSANEQRRHLNSQQRAAIAVQFLEVYEAAARERQGERTDLPEKVPGSHADARDLVAADFGTNGKYVQDAKNVSEWAPELLDDVVDGTLPLKDAADEAKARKKKAAGVDPVPAPAPEVVQLVKLDGTFVDYPKPKRSTFNRSTGDGISWADWSWNPVTGCEHSCTYCYAREIANNPRFASAYPVGFEPVLHPERLVAPAETKLPSDQTLTSHNVFVCSMADLFGKWVPDEWIDGVLNACRANPQWRYLFLTKFPSRYKGITFPPKAWVGTSVDSQRRVEIAMHSMAEVDAEVRWLSIEPLLEPLHFDSLAMFDWIVIGAQTSTAAEKAVAPKFEWVANLVAQARRDGVRVHLKPNLLSAPGMELPDEYPA